MRFALLSALTLTTAMLPAQTPQHFTGTWASSQQIPEPNNALPSADLDHALLREIVHLSTGGSTIRIHVSNAFGTQPLHLLAVHVAKPVSPAGSALVPGTDRPVLFDGKAEVTLPAAAEYLSDPLSFPAAPGSDLAITLQTAAPPAQQTGHPGSRATSYIAHGASPDATTLPGAKTIDHWYFLSGVDVLGFGSAVVALGDSITDGHGATTNGNDRWTDVLAARLRTNKSTSTVGVLNQGIGGNHLLTDGLGPNALARFDRDVLAQPGVREVIVLEGINDLGGATRNGPLSPEAHAALVAHITGAYAQMIARAHDAHLRIYGATITPDTGSGYYHPDAAAEADRQAVNAWIRQAGHFDAVIDFDKVVQDPAQPDRLLPKYDSGDHLHPSPAGYKAMGEAVPLPLLR